MMTERIKALERANFNLTRFNLILLLGLFGVAFHSYLIGARDVLTARQFVLLDENGVKRAALLSGPDGADAGLSLWDHKGNKRASLHTIPAGASLSFWDEADKRRAILGTLPDSTGLNLWDAKGKKRASLETIPHGAGLSLWDENGKKRAGLETDPTSTDLDFFGETGVSRVILGTAEKITLANPDIRIEDQSVLTLYDGEGKVLQKFP